jgi:hypothetical protein
MTTETWGKIILVPGGAKLLCDDGRVFHKVSAADDSATVTELERFNGDWFEWIKQGEFFSDVDPTTVQRWIEAAR